MAININNLCSLINILINYSIKFIYIYIIKYEKNREIH